MSPKKILERNGLSITDSRLKILHFFCTSSKACSISHLLKNIKDSNRITLYRTLKCFVQKRILFTVSSKENQPLFFLPQAQKKNEDNVINTFFICKDCGHVISLHTNISLIDKIPDTVWVEDETLLMTGLCGDCVGQKPGEITLRKSSPIHKQCTK